MLWDTYFAWLGHLWMCLRGVSWKWDVVSEHSEMSSRGDACSLSLSTSGPWHLLDSCDTTTISSPVISFHSYPMVVTNTISVTSCHFKKVTICIEFAPGSPSISFGHGDWGRGSTWQEGLGPQIAQECTASTMVNQKQDLYTGEGRRSHDCFMSEKPERNQEGSPAVPGCGSLDGWGLES